MPEMELVKVDPTGLKVGAKVSFYSKEEIYNEDGRKLMHFDSGWVTGMNYLCGKEFELTKRMVYDFSHGYYTIWEDEQDSWNISLDMVKFPTEIEEEREELNLSLIREYDDSIIKEMISKVDKVRFTNLLTVGSMTTERVDKKYVDLYLDRWAESKYPYYLLFGKNLSISEEFESDMTESDMRDKIEDLCYKFPQYSNLFKNEFYASEFINNELTELNEYLSKYAPTICVRGMKVSKILSELCKDKKLDDAISLLMSNRKVKTTLTISIDPYDYLTMSLNNNNWQSCQKIGEGSYATGALSIMIDSSSLISYKWSGEEQPFNYNNYKWKGNSKSWRQCIYIDPLNSGMIFSREYPQYIPVITAEIRNILEKQISDYLDIPNEWTKLTNQHIGYVQNSSLLYHDVEEGFGHTQIIHKSFTKKDELNFKVGEDIFCTKCGKEISSANDSFRCSRCGYY